jgi:glycine dehydrogenase subunit 2
MNEISPIRPEAAVEATTFTGNRALMLEEPLIFEMGLEDGNGRRFQFDAPRTATGCRAWAGLERNRPIDLPGSANRRRCANYTRLSRQNYGIDLGFFPLGSCTMKHNPRLNERSRECRALRTFTRCSRSTLCRARWR